MCWLKVEKNGCNNVLIYESCFLQCSKKVCFINSSIIGRHLYIYEIKMRASKNTNTLKKTIKKLRFN